MELPHLPILPKLKEIVQKLGQTTERAAQDVLHGVQKVGHAEINTVKQAGREGGQVISNIAQTVNKTKQKVFNSITPKSPQEGLAQGMIPMKNRNGSYSYIDATGITEINNVSKAAKPLIKDAIKETKPILEDTLGKLIKAIKEATPIRKGQEALYTAEKAKRVAVGSKALESGGEQGFYKALGALKGELPKVNFESPRKLFNQHEVDSLFSHIKDAPGDFFDKITASTGLGKLLGKTGGAVPTDSELKALRNVFGSDLIDAIRSKRSGWEKFKEGFANAINVPRSILSSFDMSAPLRQGVVLGTAHPVRAAQAFKEMFKYFGSEKVFTEATKEILSRPTAQLMKESKLAITDTTRSAIGLVNKEEQFMSNFAEKIPVVGRVVKASERSYVGFLNKLRADVFDDLANEYIKSGIKPAEQPEVFKGLAKFINNATGRGDLPGSLNRAAPLLNGVFFSPRLMASRFNTLFNPQYYASLPAPVRKQAAKDFLKFVGTGVGILGLAKLGGASVEANPTSADFGKIRLGNTRYDIWGGHQQWVRFGAQLLTGQMKSTTTGNVTKLDGKSFGGDTRLSRVGDFIQGKFNPVAGLVADLLRGQSLIGEPITTEKETYEKTVPLIIQDIIDAAKDGGPAKAISAAPAFFGVGVQTYQPTQKKSGLSLPSIKSNTSAKALPALPKLPKLNQ